jgi:ubiquitin-conjugating enzyme E2 variant
MLTVIEFVGTIVICWLAADFLSGFFHWLEDRYAREEWPIIGEFIAKPNNLHHAVPSAFLAGNYWKRNWTTLAIALPFFAMTFPSRWCLIFLFVSQANEIHAWSHQRCNGWIRGMQQAGILNSPREHGTHHRAPFDVRYCVMSDWLNPLLDGIGFWQHLEAVISTTGIRPKDAAVPNQ